MLIYWGVLLWIGGVFRDQWIFFRQEVEPLIACHHKRPGRPPGTCAVLFVLRTGVSWRDLPSCFGNWHTVYTRFKRGSENGLEEAEHAPCTTKRRRISPLPLSLSF